MALELGISITDHGKLPDVVFYDAERNWLFLVEAVTSHGPMSPTRIVDLENMLSDAPRVQFMLAPSRISENFAST